MTNLFRHATDVDTFPIGANIFTQGEAGELMYVIQAGEVDLFVSGNLVATLGEGEIVGEMALIDKAPRSATAIARTDCQLVPVSEERFKFLVQQTPFFALQVMRTMALRLRAMNDAT